MSGADRPRDRLGRPLAAGDDEAYPSLNLPADISDEQCWLLACELLDTGLPFHAHEACEHAWRRTQTLSSRALWQGLAQWCAARTHEARGNVTGARAVADRASVTLSGVDEPPPWIDLADVESDCRRLMQLDGT